MKKGFTLIELLATIAIMAILIAAVLPFVSNYRKWAQETNNKRSAQLVFDAISRYQTLGGDLSTINATTLKSALVAAPSAGTYLLKTDGSNFDRFLAKAVGTDVSVTVSPLSVNVGGQIVP